MDFKNFFKSKLNITAVVFLGLSFLCVILSTWLSIFVSFACFMFAITFGLSAVIVHFYYKRATSLVAYDNIKLTLDERKKLEKQNKSRKASFIMGIIILIIFAVILIYYGFTML